MSGSNGRRFSLLLLIVFPVAALAQDTFSLAGNVIDQGTRQDFDITIAAGESDPATRIPVTVLRGRQPGRTVLMVAGVHGYEFASILAAKDLAEKIDPETLAGTFIIVRLAHVSAFEERSPYVNPHDRKNLNRSFPGIADGTQTERIAYVLATEIIPKADVVFDVHSGDGAEWLEAFIGVYGGRLATDFPLALSLAESFGFPNIVRYKMETQEQVDRGRSLNRQAVAEGRPTLLVEIGQNGSRDPEHVEMIVNGVQRALASLDMIAPIDVEPRVEPRYFEGTQSVPVNNTGIWTPVSPEGHYVQRGETMGVIHSYSGELVETVVAPVDGYAIYGLAGPPVRSGDSVAQIAHPVEQLDE